VISSPFFVKKMSLPFPAATSSSSSFHQRAVQLWRVTIKFLKKEMQVLLAALSGAFILRLVVVASAVQQPNGRQDEIRLSSRRFLMWRNVGKCCCTSA
jgi:hypothetical protein